MGGEWQRVAISDIADIVLGGTPSKTNPEYWESGTIFWATAKDIAAANGRFIYQTENKITQLGLKNSAAKVLPPGTIVITARGTVGAIARLGHEMAFNQTCYGIVPRNKQVYEDYLYYALKATVRRMKSHAYGTVFDTITKKTFDSWSIPLPPLPEQRAIAHILGTLDDKIELNRQMNETLEAMAQAIFKSWFVDFDPVVVNAIKAGNPIPDKFAERAAHYRANLDSLGLPDHILNLFPDRFVDSDLDPIPEGWKVGRLGDVIEIHDRKRIPLNRRERAKRKGPYPYYGASGIMDYVDDYLFDGIYVLLGEDGTVIDENNHPAVQYVWGQFWVNNHAHVLSGTSGVSSEHLYLMLRRANVRPFVTGAVQPKISQTNLKRIPIILSNGEVQILFSEIIKPLFSNYRQNSEEINILENARDALLPKLISGELRVPNVEKVLEGAE